METIQDETTPFPADKFRIKTSATGDTSVQVGGKTYGFNSPVVQRYLKNPLTDREKGFGAQISEHLGMSGTPVASSNMNSGINDYYKKPEPAPAPVSEPSYDYSGGNNYGTDVNTDYIDKAYNNINQTNIDNLGAIEDSTLGTIDDMTKEWYTKMGQQGTAYLDNLKQSYTPQYNRIDDVTAQMQEATRFSGAAAGSVRGSKQEQNQQEVLAKADIAKQAVDAEIQAKMEMYQAQLQGAPPAELTAMQSKLEGIRDRRLQSELDLATAQEDAQTAQVEGAAAAQAMQLEKLDQYYAAQGLSVNPFTGEAVSSLEGQKMKAEIANSDANTAKAYAAANDANIDITYKTDELGNVSAIVSDKSTGEFEMLQLGKLDAAQQWAIGATGGGNGPTGPDGNPLGFDPSKAAIYAELDRIDFELGKDSDEYDRAQKRYQDEGYTAWELEVGLDAYQNTPVSQGGGLAESPISSSGSDVPLGTGGLGSLLKEITTPKSGQAEGTPEGWTYN